MTVRARAMRHAALLLVSGLLLSGCMSLEDLAGFHAPPREDTSGTLVDVDQAERIVTRVLQAAGAAESATGEQAAAERAAVLTGTALEVATARAAAGSTPADTLSRPEPATVLGLSQGPQFPRFILATSPDARSGRQYLDVLVSSSVTQPYQLENRVPMLPGAALPSLGVLEDGTALLAVDDGTGLVLAPGAAVEAYVASLRTPDPVSHDAVDSSDAYATAIKRAQTTQAESLGSLASLSQAHGVVPESVRAFRLMDGGAVVLARVNRTDSVVAGANTQELKVPEALQRFTGTATATKSITINAIQVMALLVPAEGQGKVTLLGASELLVSGAAE